MKKDQFFKDNQKELKSRTNFNNLILQYLKPQTHHDPEKIFAYFDKNAFSNFKFEKYFTESVCIKTNLIFLFISVLFMVFYAYLINSILGFISDENSKFLADNYKQKAYQSNFYSRIFFTKNLTNFMIVPGTMLFQKFKYDKVTKSILSEHRCILFSVFGIYLLSIWDLSDVYSHSRIHELNLETVKITNNLNKNYLFESMLEVKNLAQSNSTNKFAKNEYFYIKNYFPNYQQIIERNVKHHFNRQPDNNGNFNQELIANSDLQIIFLFKENKNSFGTLPLVFFLLLIIIKLKKIEKLFEFRRNINYREILSI